jgi:dipeptidyl aminopeptidase/acylaminoacyl peptidase
VKTNLVVIKGGDHGFSEPTHRAEAYAAMASWFAENL